MRHRLKQASCALLALLLTVQLLPLPKASAASAFEGVGSGEVLFQGESNVDRQFVSETDYLLAPGVTEYVTYTNEPSGLNQNIDFFCEVDLSQAEIMVGYADMEGILTNHEINWRMQTVSDQAKNAQNFFNRSEDYADATIVAALNADFYNMATGQPTGALIIDGVTYNPTNGRYYFGITKDGQAVISNDTDTSNLNYAVGGSTLLLRDGEVLPSPGGRNVTYTAIGIKSDGTVVSMVCYGQRYPVSCGYTQYEVAQMMRARGCVTALMLDGSGSSTFVSRREGDSGIVTRNNPSDGQERQVSSSIFIVSRVQADGVFDHAAISPDNEVYTPGSTVQFSAAGADKSGGPAPLPSDATWTVDAAYGTINSSTGLFRSNGTAGDVTVYLNSGAQVVGQTTITIANPDQITFAEETASIGQGDTSDLGLRVYYQQREVHYKEGDFEWKIEPTQYSRRQWTGSGSTYETVVETVEESPEQMKYLTLGSVSDNQLTCEPVYTGANTNPNVPDGYVLNDSEKTASAITAIVTVTSKAATNPEVSGSVTVEACKDPLVAMDFEGGNTKIFHSFETYAGQFDENGEYTAFETPKTQEEIAAEYGYTCVSYAGRTTDGRQVGKAEVVSRADGYPVRFGEYSMRVDYDFSTNTGSTDGACFGATEDIELADLGNPTRIGIWVYIPKGTPNLWLRLQYRDGSGNASQLDFTENDIYRPNNVARNADDNWHYFEADISNLQTPVTIPAGMSVRIMMSNPKQSIGAAKLWASPVGWVKCQTDENGNIILTDRDDPRLTQFVGGYSTTPLNIGEVVPETVTLGTTGETVSIDKVPIPEYLATFDSNGNNLTKGNLSGTLYFDNITFVYGSTPEDTAAPEVESITVQAGSNEAVALTNGMTLTSGELTVEAMFSDSTETDRNNTGVQSATLYVDQRQLEGATVDMGGGILRGGVKLSNGSHTIRVSVVDNYGNETSREFTVTINDPEGAGAPVEVTQQETTAVLGGQIHLDFIPRDTSINSITVTLDIPRAFAENYQIVPAEGCTIDSQNYNSAAQELTFTVTGTVETGSMVSFTLSVPTTAATGEELTIAMNGLAGGETFNATPTWTVTAPYTVISGQMVAGVEDTCYFQINHSASGLPALGVALYSGDTQLGVSDAEGRVSYTPKDGERSLTVTARADDGGVSAAYTASIYRPQGNVDGTPTRVWRNAADAADQLNVTWLANPICAEESAQVQIAESEAGIAEGQIYETQCDLVTFISDNAAAYVCSAEVTGLKEGVTYYYRVGDGIHWSAVRSFTTTYANTGIDALVLGDLQENDNANLAGILEKAGADSMDLVLQTGDLVDNGSSYTYWNNTMGMLDQLTMDRLFAVGNHELEGSLDPNQVIYNQEDSSYYSIQVGNVFVATIAYNSFSTEVLEQMVTDAQASGATWKLLVTHQPPYYTNIVAGMGLPTQRAIADAAQRAGIDVVLSGHDHSYARTEPLWDGEVVGADEGITYFICGSLGEKSYSVSDTEGFHFVQATDDYQALYLTLSTTDQALTIRVYDYQNGNPEMIDSFVKVKGETGHEHAYTWNGSDLLTCTCGYRIPSSSYTGYAAYTTPAGKSGQVYFNAGKLMTGLFAVGEDIVRHAGEDGLLHNSDTINTAQCWENGYLSCWCYDCNTIYQFSETRRQGHLYDENHICTRQVFNMDTYRFETCGHQGKDIATLDIELAYQYGYYTGAALRPAVTVTDPETGYELFPQSTYGDYMPYWDNNVNVGTATVRIVGYSDGPYYGETSCTFQIVPQNLSADDFTVTATSNSVRLEWEPALGATQYIVYQSVDGAWQRLGIVSEPKYTVIGLDTGEYQFCVRPFATVDGTDYYSTRNSDPVTAVIASGGVTFTEGSAVTRTYGDPSFFNEASGSGGETGFTYSSSDPQVASVDAATGEVTIGNAGSAVITAEREDLTGQYRITVLPKEVTLIWSGTQTRTYDGQPSSVTAQADGLLTGDTTTVTVVNGDQKDAGTHTAVASSLSNGNYALPEACTAEYAISPAEITKLTWSADSLIYTGQPIAPTATAAEGLVAGDTVTFTVPTATEPGTYQVTAVSRNPNYVVAETVEPYQFTIALPTITLSKNGAEVENVTAHMDGTTIVLTGFVASEGEEITVTVTGSQAASAEISAGETGSVTLGGVTYGIDATGLVPQPVSVTLKTGETEVRIAEDVLSDLTEEQQEQLNSAASSLENQFINLLAAAAPAVEEIVDKALEGVQGVTEVTMELSQRLEVVAYKPGESYTVNITPVYLIIPEGAASDTAPIASGVLTNDQITAPVEVSFQVPADILLNDSTTFIRHQRSDGRWEYIRPVRITGQILTFWTDSFSEFEVLSDSRIATVCFPAEDATSTTRVFTPADLGTKLPELAKEGYTFDGWKIEGETYTEVTEDFLTALDGKGILTAEAVFTEHETPPVDPGHGGGGGGITSYSITKKAAENGSIAVSRGSAAEGDTVTITVTPDEGYQLETLTVTDTAGNELEIADKGNGQYTFTMPRSRVTVEATFAETGTGDPLPFADVDGDSWFYSAVAYVYENGMMEGTGDNLFAPTNPLNRAMMVQVLWNLEGGPAAGGTTVYSDVASGTWYYDAVQWAAAEGLAGGYGNGLFGPEDNITREQMALMLYRYAQYKGYDVNNAGNLDNFADGGETSDWAEEAMAWAVGAGLLNGKGDGILDPGGNATRAEIAQIFMNFCENVAK